MQATDALDLSNDLALLVLMKVSGFVFEVEAPAVGADGANVGGGGGLGGRLPPRSPSDKHYLRHLARVTADPGSSNFSTLFERAGRVRLCSRGHLDICQLCSTSYPGGCFVASGPSASRPRVACASERGCCSMSILLVRWVLDTAGR